jgi:nitrite reductase/ring-hydroxylating ferredoxin subunit
MAKWIKAYEEKDFSGQVKLFVHEGRCIALFKLGDGIYAIDDECSYAQASLSEGTVDDDQIECPQHGAWFDIRSGKNLSFPAVTPVRVYLVKVEDGTIYLSLEN